VLQWQRQLFQPEFPDNKPSFFVVDVVGVNFRIHGLPCGKVNFDDSLTNVNAMTLAASCFAVLDVKNYL